MSVNTLRYLFRVLFTTSCSKRPDPWTVSFRNSLQFIIPQYVPVLLFCPHVMCEIFLVVGIYDIDCVMVLHGLNVVHRTHQTEVIRRNIFVSRLSVAGKRKKKRKTKTNRQIGFWVDEKLAVPLIIVGSLWGYCLAFGEVIREWGGGSSWDSLLTSSLW